MHFYMVDFSHRKKLCLKISPYNIKIPLANQLSSDPFSLYFSPKALPLFTPNLNIFRFPAGYSLEMATEIRTI